MIVKPWTNLISLDTVIRLHSEGMKKYGGLLSPPNIPCLEGSLGSAYSAGLYMTPVDQLTALGLVFCGYLLFYLARNHCFTEGNKRVAWTSAMHVLLSLKLSLNVDQEIAESFCDDVVKGNIASGAIVVNWIADRLEEAES